jgi:hypothetical protein
MQQVHAILMSLADGPRTTAQLVGKVPGADPERLTLQLATLGWLDAGADGWALTDEGRLALARSCERTPELTEREAEMMYVPRNVRRGTTHKRSHRLRAAW